MTDLSHLDSIVDDAESITAVVLTAMNQTDDARFTCRNSLNGGVDDRAGRLYVACCVPAGEALRCAARRGCRLHQRPCNDALQVRLISLGAG